MSSLSLILLVDDNDYMMGLVRNLGKGELCVLTQTQKICKILLIFLFISTSIYLVSSIVLLSSIDAFLCKRYRWCICVDFYFSGFIQCTNVCLHPLFIKVNIFYLCIKLVKKLFISLTRDIMTDLVYVYR